MTPIQLVTRCYLEGLPAVTVVYDRHICGTSTAEPALTTHLVMPEAVVDDDPLARATGEPQRKFGFKTLPPPDGNDRARLPTGTG